ncbi:MAG TPA: hypothetical protein VHK64_08195, partial [Nocardioidaceae bacterium]|nr:hypothetical protein [Nocardioidaceae bacterium]
MRTEEQIQADARDGSPFSNGTEGYAWMENWCGECVHNDEETETYCPILSVALLGQTPAEWVEQPWQQIAGRPEGELAPTLGGQYVCTEFERRRDDDGDDPGPEPEPPPVCDGQLDIVDAYLPVALAELSTAPERVP